MRLDFQIYLQAIANADSAEYCSSLNKNHDWAQYNGQGRGQCQKIKARPKINLNKTKQKHDWKFHFLAI